MEHLENIAHDWWEALCVFGCLAIVYMSIVVVFG